MTNAIRHGIQKEPGEGVPAEIRVKVQGKVFNRFLIIVEDDGDGVPVKEARKIFEPFYRREVSVADQKPGSGLGLHLVTRIADLLGGKVTLESPYEDIAGHLHPGCRFTVDLPTTRDA